tara:strand:- start:186 stop:386 length:201 start_codon:yes stop_codon:yes gene_type:complete
MTKNTLPNKLTCCLPPGSEHEQKSTAHEWITRLLKNCDVEETHKDYDVVIAGNIAVFELKKTVRKV